MDGFEHYLALRIEALEHLKEKYGKTGIESMMTQALLDELHHLKAMYETGREQWF